MEIRINKVGLVLFMLLSALSLGACRTDPASQSTSSSTTSTTTTTTPTTTTTTPTTTTPTTTTPPAVAYTMSLAPALTSLSAGGTTAVTATIYANGVVDTTQVVEVTFTSSCAAQGKATLDSPVVSSAGKAVSTYTDVKCASTDTLGASATINGTTVSASASLTVQAASMGSIQFIGANPAHIGIKGVGLTETSLVQFQVKDVNGQPAPPNYGVTFSLDTTTGGVTFSPATAMTDANGLVSTTITSGTIPATVRVTATLSSNTGIKSQSDGLVISTGISDQNSFSISLSAFNIEGLQYDGETVDVTIRASDHFNNPVPDGSAVLFTAEGGQIQSSCLITAGACTVKWTSSDPRPADGRVTILATMTGEESFKDTNGNNRYDDGETFTDLPEAWLDEDESGTYAYGEEIRDFDGSGSYTLGDTKYNGVLCNGPANCGTKSLDVRASAFITMSSSDLYMVFLDNAGNPVDPAVGYATAIGTTINRSAYVCSFNANALSDWTKGQLPPAGTKIEGVLDNGTLTITSSATVPNSAAKGCYLAQFSIKAPATAGSGNLSLKATTPKSIVTTGVIPITYTP